MNCAINGSEFFRRDVTRDVLLFPQNVLFFGTMGSQPVPRTMLTRDSLLRTVLSSPEFSGHALHSII